MKYIGEGYIEQNNSQIMLFDRTGNSIDDEKKYAISYLSLIHI